MDGQIVWIDDNNSDIDKDAVMKFAAQLEEMKCGECFIIPGGLTFSFIGPQVSAWPPTQAMVEAAAETASRYIELLREEAPPSMAIWHLMKAECDQAFHDYFWMQAALLGPEGIEYAHEMADCCP